MNLFDLPPEVLAEITDLVVLDYGLKRSMELRRLCRFFACECTEALCRTGAIEEFWPRGLLDVPGRSRERIIDSPWYRLLTPIVLRSKVQRDAPGENPLIDSIRDTTEQLVKRGHDRSQTLRRLSEAVSVLWGSNSIFHVLGDSQMPRQAPPENLGLGAAVDLLVAAAMLGDYDIVMQAEIDLLPMRSTYFGSVLTAVCMQGDLNRFGYLLQHHTMAKYICGVSGQPYPPQVPLRYAAIDGERYPLNAAVYGGHIELLMKLSTDKQDERFGVDIASVLPTAAESGKLPVMKFLLHSLSDIIGVSISRLLGDRIEQRLNPTGLLLGEVLTLRAVTYGHRELAEYLINHGAKKALLKQNSRAGTSLLRVAAAHGDKKMTVMLLENGIPPNKMTSKKSPLNTAICYGWTDVAEILIEHGAEIPNQGVPAPIVWAAANGDKNLVQLLLEKEAELNTSSTSMINFVYTMTYKNNFNLEMIEILRKGGLKDMDMAQIKNFLKIYPWEWHEITMLIPKLYTILRSQGLRLTPKELVLFLRKSFVNGARSRPQSSVKNEKHGS